MMLIHRTELEFNLNSELKFISEVDNEISIYRGFNTLNKGETKVKMEIKPNMNRKGEQKPKLDANAVRQDTMTAIKKSEDRMNGDGVIKPINRQKGLTAVKTERLSERRDKLGWLGRLMDKNGRIPLKKFITALQFERKPVTTEQLKLAFKLVKKPKSRAERLDMKRDKNKREFLAGDGRQYPMLSIGTPVISDFKRGRLDWKSQRLNNIRRHFKLYGVNEKDFYGTRFARLALAVFIKTDSDVFVTKALVKYFVKEYKSKRHQFGYSLSKILANSQKEFWRKSYERKKSLMSDNEIKAVEMDSNRKKKPRTSNRKGKGLKMESDTLKGLIAGGNWEARVEMTFDFNKRTTTELPDAKWLNLKSNSELRQDLETLLESDIVIVRLMKKTGKWTAEIPMAHRIGVRMVTEG